MKKYPLLAYSILLALICTGVVVRIKALGPQGVMLVQVYMLTPAIAAILTRFFFYEPKFKDANLRFGKLSDYFKYWLLGIGITALSYVFFTLLGSITWDFTGNTFLTNLSKQFSMTGQNMQETLPEGFTPQIITSSWRLARFVPLPNWPMYMSKVEASLSLPWRTSF